MAALCVASYAISARIYPPATAHRVLSSEVSARSHTTALNPYLAPSFVPIQDIPYLIRRGGITFCSGYSIKHHYQGLTWPEQRDDKWSKGFLQTCCQHFLVLSTALMLAFDRIFWRLTIIFLQASCSTSRSQWVKAKARWFWDGGGKKTRSLGNRDSDGFTQEIPRQDWTFLVHLGFEKVKSNRFRAGGGKSWINVSKGSPWWCTYIQT